jgi:hypothetical protein
LLLIRDEGIPAMSRSKKQSLGDENHETSPKPVSFSEYVRVTQDSCRHGQCGRDQLALAAAYEQYVNNPAAPWNKNRREQPNRRFKRD